MEKQNSIDFFIIGIMGEKVFTSPCENGNLPIFGAQPQP